MEYYRLSTLCNIYRLCHLEEKEEGVGDDPLLKVEEEVEKVRYARNW